ncbi:pyruvate dehydrogenase E2 component (dihydrolipoamide acetyltransferase) [Planifilum fimeticola]|uniref:Dihydrolipoamide acetyltransferase component of pyruvate dehydrogenase complex n=1 Tax=Planifilum fimeticola TaxID=201975 RepID=A0A2T0LES1_9BACL|nr:dihydrolipoamide acetyltransferase family protein [Planifilum fimeticola]PRX40617.1 pyruvate dehydrogenase E2 component (dihydrolipoamide acetyltransferase) [Planifilum fimeticola]
MAEEVLMPKLGMTMEKGTILRWLKKEGEQVQAGEPLLEVMTDKINIEVESEISGTLLKIYYGEEEEVPVNRVIAYIGEAGEKVPEAPPGVEGSARNDRVSDPAQPEAERESAPATAVKKVRATPSARKLARQLGVSLDQVPGTGPRGRVHRSDVETYASQIRREKETTPPFSREEEKRGETPAAEAIRMGGIRRAVARRMTESAMNAPHVTLFTEVDMGETIRLRKQLLPLVEKETGYRLSYTELIMKAAAQALARHPRLNASLKGDDMILHREIHIGLAVDVPDGLVVPVVKHVDRKGVAELVRECKSLAELARQGKLTPDQIQGGTFTVSNLGMYEVDGFTPIINPPESAILGVGRISEKPVGVGGEICLRPMMTLSLSFDHRVVDGAPAAAFLTDLKGILEHPYRMIA